MQTSLPIYLSHPRFNRYLKEVNDDFDKALALYEANIRLSGAAMEAINVIEVALRNAFDAELRKWNKASNGVEEWIKLPAGDLLNYENPS